MLTRLFEELELDTLLELKSINNSKEISEFSYDCDKSCGQELGCWCSWNYICLQKTIMDKFVKSANGCFIKR